ncbi:lysoplasmalogenase family protein [Emticicia sp. SJ17W-69]|uniref:lysoplasmalogenase family protein n=1 Tax=Emticicia sp. SJ17W-69 TaxID=3421657 RepID=UPI003EBD0A5C
MKKLWYIVYCCAIPAIIFANFYTETIFIQKIGGIESITNLILVLYYITNRKSKFVTNDWLLIEALLFTCVGGILLQLYENEELLYFINTMGFYLSQFTYINIFRNEGSSLPPYFSAFREWKLMAVSILFILGLLFVFTPYIPDKLLVISFIYSTQMLILCWMAYYRPIEKKAYQVGILGAVLLIFSNVWLTISLLVAQFPYMVLIYFIFYSSSQYFILESILKNINNSTLTSDNPS